MVNQKLSATAAGNPIRCKAAICRKAGEPLVVEEITVAPPSSHEVRIRIICTSLCQSDVTFWKLKDVPTAVFPRILGHEAIGLLEEPSSAMALVPTESTQSSTAQNPAAIYFTDCRLP